MGHAHAVPAPLLARYFSGQASAETAAEQGRLAMSQMDDPVDVAGALFGALLILYAALVLAVELVFWALEAMR